MSRTPRSCIFSRPRLARTGTLVSVGVLAVTVMTGCSVGQSLVDPDAWSLNGVSMSKGDFETLVADAIESGIYAPANGGSSSSISGDDARELINVALQAEALRQFLPLVDEKITEADIAAGVAQAPQLADVTGSMKDLIDGYIGINSVLERIVAPEESLLRTWYERMPVLAGSLCARHILVPTESEARDVLERLADGMTFEEASSRYSTDESVADTGGALEGENGPCIPNTDVFGGGFDPGFVAGAVDAEIGVPSGPVESQFGWHVILIRPWSEVSESVVANLRTLAGARLLVGFLGAADVSVASEYGTWSRSDFSVVAD